MKSIFDDMTPEQKEAALNYKGEEAFGDPRWRENRKLTTLIKRLRETIAAHDVWYQNKTYTSDALLERLSLERKEAADALEELQAENRALAIQMDDMADLLEHYIDKDETIKWENKDEP